MDETRIAADQTPLTFMESFTIGALLAFSKVPADVVIIDCGMAESTRQIQLKKSCQHQSCQCHLITLNIWAIQSRESLRKSDTNEAANAFDCCISAKEARNN